MKFIISFATMSKKSEVDSASVKRKLTRPEKVPASGKKKKKETIQQQQQQQQQQVEGTIQQLELARLPGEEFVKTEVLMSSSERPFIPAPQPMIIDPPVEQDQAIQNLMNEIDSLDQITQTETQIQFVDQAVQTDPMHLPAAPEGVAHCSNQLPDIRDNCPIHGIRLMKNTSPKGFSYLRCPHFDQRCNKSCGIMTGIDDSVYYLETVSRSLHPEIRFLWDKLSCFCNFSPMLKKSASQKNPGRLYLTCRYKQCEYFQWADAALFEKNREWLQQQQQMMGSACYSMRGVGNGRDVVPVTSGNAFPPGGAEMPKYEFADPRIPEPHSVDIPGPPPRNRSFDDYMKDEGFIRSLPKDFREKLIHEYVSSVPKGIEILGRRAGWHNF